MDRLQPVTNRQSVYGNHNRNGWKLSNALDSVLKLTSIEIFFFQRQTWLYIKHTLPINNSLPQSRATHRSSCRLSVVLTNSTVRQLVYSLLAFHLVSNRILRYFSGMTQSSSHLKLTYVGEYVSLTWKVMLLYLVSWWQAFYSLFYPTTRECEKN